MTGADNRRQKRLRKTKAQLVDELEALERKHTKHKLDAAGGKDSVANALLEIEGPFLALLDNSPTAIFVRDVEGGYRFVNLAYEEWYKVDRKKILGKKPYDFFKRETADRITAFHKEVLESGTRIEREVQTTHKDGSTRNQWVIQFPITAPDGKTIGVCGILSDLSERERAEGAIQESEQRLRGAIDSLQEGFALYDADDRLIAFNKKYGRLRPDAQAIMERGGTFEDVLRANIKHEILPEFIGREETYVQERLKQHKDPKGPLIRRFKDGTWSMVEEVKTPDGGTAITLIDITEVKRAEEALRRNEALLRAVVNYSPTKIHIKDVEGRYTLINKEAEKLFGITDEEGRGKTSYDLFPKEVADAFMAHDKAVIESGTPTEGEEEFELEDGVHTFLTVKFPIYDLEGVAAVGAIGTDITDRKQAEENVRRLAKAIEELSENFALYDANDRLILCNESYRNFNWRIKEAITPGTSFEDNIRALVDKGLVAEAEGREEKWIQERIERHRYPSGPFEIARQDGRWLHVREQRIPDGSTVTIATDITERKRAEAALQESEDRFRGFAEMASDWFWEMGPDLRFSYFSPRYAEITGFPIADRIGTRRSDFMPAENLEGHSEKWAAHLADLEARRPFRNFEYSTTASVEGLRFVRVSGEPVFGADGEFLGYRGTGTDITQSKKAEKELLEAKEQAEFANRAKTDFLANISHELRTPLNSILGFSEILARETLGPLGTPKYKEYSGDIHSSGTHLLGLINEVLDLSKLEAGEFEIIESEIDVAGTVNSCVKMVERRSTGEMASVTSEFADELPRLLGDEKRLKQILLNLLGNAVKFTPPGGNVKVTARICNSGRHTIEVSDNGVGIAEDDILKVLEPFGQALDVHTRDHEGTGLGLYLAKSFTEMHGGTLDIVSGLGKGTTVTLRFPKERTLRTH